MPRGCGLGGQGKDFVVLAVDKFDCDLNAVQRVVAGEINGALRVLEVVSIHGVCRPIAEAAQIELRPDVLQKNFHALQPYWYE